MARAAIWELVPLVTLMAVAVVASPIPSAPIALTTGATYGHLWGTVQVMIGAELGALIAFGLARPLGHDFMRRMFGDRVDAGLLVFASRLMPFVSLDITSYAAGLSRPHVWRFALATLAGIVPASFLLAHFGGEAVSTFYAADMPNMVRTESRKELADLLAKDARKVVITTIQKFAEADGELNDRDNIIAMVDEAHRTQEGDFGRKMREALPNAFLFGARSTPMIQTSPKPPFDQS